MYQSQNFQLYDSIVFYSTGDGNLNGKHGEIIGLPCHHLHPAPHHYIVLLDELYHGNKALSITEACLLPLWKWEEN